MTSKSELIKQYHALREAQNAYFDQRRMEGTKFPSKEAKQLLIKSKRIELETDALFNIEKI
jgi:hypothetical protein